MAHTVTRLVNLAIPLYRDEPVFNSEISARSGFPWRCDIWEKTGDWPLFGTAWGKSRTEALAKANSIVHACGMSHFKEE